MMKKEETKTDPTNPEIDDEVDDEDDLEEKFVPEAPDGGWGWVVLFGALMCHFLIDGVVYVFGVVFPQLVEHFGESKGKVAMVQSVQIGVSLCSGPITSGLVNKFGCRAVTISGSVIAATGFILGSFAPNLEILIFTYGVLGGIGFGMVYLPCIVIVGFYFEKKRALATGIATCGSGIGTFFFSPLNKFLLDLYGWRNLMFIQAAIILNCAVCGMLMRPLKPVRRKKLNLNHLERGLETVSEQKESQEEENEDETETDYYDDNLFLSDLMAKKTKTPAITTPARGRASLPAVHFVPKNGMNNDSYMNDEDQLGQVHLFKKTVPNVQKRRSRAASQPEILAHKMDFSRPLYRKDIFYNGSIEKIPQFQFQPNMRRYSISITAVPGVSEPEKKASVWDRCSCLPKSVTDILKEMLDISLMLNVVFLVLFVGNVFTCTGYFIPFTYLVDQAEILGIRGSNGAFLISIMGISETTGRILCGFIADLSFISPLHLNNVMLMLSGIAVFMVPFCTTFPTLLAFSALYGLFVASYMSLTSPIICDLLGIEILSNAFGLIALSRGISATFGPPIAGALFQATHEYHASFYLCGGMFLAGGICHMILPFIRKKK